MKTIQTGQTLTARSACDHNCIFTAKILLRKGNFATVKAQGIERRVKIMTSDEGEYIFAMGKFSMTPIFRAI